jgi:hypothetical protein
MPEKHSGWSNTARGVRANSQGRPRAITRMDSGSRVDLDGVPLRHTKKSDVELPPEFWEEFKRDRDAAILKWTADGA